VGKLLVLRVQKLHVSCDKGSHCELYDGMADNCVF